MRTSDHFTTIQIEIYCPQHTDPAVDKATDTLEGFEAILYEFTRRWLDSRGPMGKKLTVRIEE